MNQEPFDQFALSIAQESWDTFRRDPALFVIAGVVYILASVCSLGLLAGTAQVGFIDMVRKVRAGEPVAVSALFSRFDSLVPATVALVVFMVLLWLGMLMLVLPGLLVLLFGAFALHMVAYERTGGIEGIRRSIALVRANFMHTLAVMLLVSILNTVGGMVIFGVLLTLPLSTIALTIGYERLALARSRSAETLTI